MEKAVYKLAIAEVKFQLTHMPKYTFYSRLCQRSASDPGYKGSLAETETHWRGSSCRSTGVLSKSVDRGKYTTKNDFATCAKTATTGAGFYAPVTAVGV